MNSEREPEINRRKAKRKWTEGESYFRKLHAIRRVLIDIPGASVEEIQAETGLSPTVVKRALRHFGLDWPVSPSEIESVLQNPEVILTELGQTAIDLYRFGLSLSEIAAALETSPQGIGNFVARMRRLGILTERRGKRGGSP